MADALEAFIEEQFNKQNTQAGQQAPNAAPEAGVEDKDDDINDYLGTVDDDLGDGQAASQPQPSQPQQPAQSSQAESQFKSAQEELDYYRMQAARSRGELEAYKAIAERQNAPQQGGQTGPGTVNPLQQVINDPYTQEELKLDPELENLYAPANPYFKNVVQKAITEYHNKVAAPMARYVQQLEQQLASTSTGVASAREQVFATQVRSVVPDVMDLTNHPQFRGFLGKNPVFSGGRWTYGDILQDAIRSGNLGAVKDVMNEFRTSVNAQQAPMQKTVSPGRPSSSLPNTAPAKRNVLKMSSLTRANEDYQAGRITYDKLQRIQQAFLEADIEGRVDYNK